MATGRRKVDLAFRGALAPGNLFGHLAATGVPGVEEHRDGAFRRTLRLAHGGGIVALRPHDAHVAAVLEAEDDRDIEAAVDASRRLLDLDADTAGIDEVLRSDPALEPLVVATPGRRVPGTTDPAELVIRIVLGQQVSTAAARTHAGRLVERYGEPAVDQDGGLTHRFPTPTALLDVDPADLAMPVSRRRCLLAVIRLLADGALPLTDPTARDELRRSLLAVPGIGPWTVEMTLLRLGDPDAFPGSDLGVRKGAAALGLPATPAALASYAERWRPYRAYAVQHLWAAEDHPINHWPPPG